MIIQVTLVFLKFSFRLDDDDGKTKPSFLASPQLTYRTRQRHGTQDISTASQGIFASSVNLCAQTMQNDIL